MLSPEASKLTPVGSELLPEGSELFPDGAELFPEGSKLFPRVPAEHAGLTGICVFSVVRGSAARGEDAPRFREGL